MRLERLLKRTAAFYGDRDRPTVRPGLRISDQTTRRNFVHWGTKALQGKWVLSISAQRQPHLTWQRQWHLARVVCVSRPVALAVHRQLPVTWPQWQPCSRSAHTYCPVYAKSCMQRCPPSVGLVTTGGGSRVWRHTCVCAKKTARHF